MKKIFLLFTLLACGYQEDNQMTKLELKQSSNAQVEIDEEQLTLKNFTESMDNFLNEFVLLNPRSKSFDTLVDYKKISKLKKSQDQKFVKTYSLISQYLAQKNLLNDLSKNEKIALMINAYNFFTIDLISDHISSGIKSITEIKSQGKPLGFAIFDVSNFNFNGSKISLNRLEKTLLYKEVQSPKGIDARFHFAVICGALGCPILNTESYKAAQLDSQLDDITSKGLLLPRNLQGSGSSYQKTALFDWYGKDFSNHIYKGNKLGSFQKFIEIYSNTQVSGNGSTIDYDWRLNIK